MIGGCSSHNGCAAIWGAPRSTTTRGRPPAATDGRRTICCRSSQRLQPAPARADAGPRSDLTPFQAAAHAALETMGIPRDRRPERPRRVAGRVAEPGQHRRRRAVQHRLRLPRPGARQAEPDHRRQRDGRPADRARRPDHRRRGDRRRPAHHRRGRPHGRGRRRVRLARPAGALGHRRSGHPRAARHQGRARPARRRQEPPRPLRRELLLLRHRRADRADAPARRRRASAPRSR